MKKLTAPTLREQFLAAQAAKPATVTPEEWPTFYAPGIDVAHFTSEAAPRDEAEQAKFDQLQKLVRGTNGMADVRDFATVARHLFPLPDYLVGCGSSHVWISTQLETEVADAGGRAMRLAIIYAQ